MTTDVTDWRYWMQFTLAALEETLAVARREGTVGEVSFFTEIVNRKREQENV